MGLFNLFKKKEIKTLLKDEDKKLLNEIERIAYVEEAKKLAKDKGLDNARKDYNYKQKESY